jgi:hypothetical protein
LRAPIAAAPSSSQAQPMLILCSCV